ncbi:MAG: hypothetical protein FJW40_01400 [Acidobacteria bacterium]|nr:hypothetical protein [Acidobacteriota bacterium]
MNCLYCRAWNPEDEHRCARCGRRLRFANARPAPDTYPLATATAPRLARVEQLTPAQPVPEPPLQASLFPVQETPKVVAITSPARRAASPAPRREPVGRRTPPRSVAATQRPEAVQQQLAFAPAPAPKPRVLRPQVESAIFCDAPVASRDHRLLAAALDTTFGLIATGAAAAVFYFSGGALSGDKVSLFTYAGLLASLLIFYRLLFCLADTDTPGMRWMDLRLLHFDGRLPSRPERFVRLASGILSLASATLGLLWALVDEETLTWHDHISKTFPTPVPRTRKS